MRSSSPIRALRMSSFRMVCVCALPSSSTHGVRMRVRSLLPLYVRMSSPPPPLYVRMSSPPLPLYVRCACIPSSPMRALPGSLLPQLLPLLPPLLPPLPPLPPLLPPLPPHITDRRLYSSSDRYYFLVITFFRSLLFPYHSS